MRKIILQHCTEEQRSLLEAAMPFNKAYALKHGFEYIISDFKRRLPDKPLNFEKLGFLKEKLPRIADGSLVIWADADTIFSGEESIEKALPENGVIGMVPTLHGVDKRQPRNWFNIGVVAMKNNATIRNFIDRVLLRTKETNDEWAWMAELQENHWSLGDGITMSKLDYKWNCWPNNEHICKTPVAVSWHGHKGVNTKLAGMKNFITKLQGTK